MITSSGVVLYDYTNDNRDAQERAKALLCYDLARLLYPNAESEEEWEQDAAYYMSIPTNIITRLISRLEHKTPTDIPENDLKWKNLYTKSKTRYDIIKDTTRSDINH